MERSDFVCVRNEPRSKHNYQETVDPIVILSPLRGSRMTGYGMTFGGFRGQGHLGVGVAALRQAQGPLLLGRAMEARGRLPPSKQKKETVKASSLFLEREKGLLPIRHRYAADWQPCGLDARGLASSSKSAYIMVTSCPRHIYAEPSSRVLATFFSLL